MPDTAMPNLPGTQLAEAGQPPADFKTLFADPLDDDYRKNLEAKDLGEGSEYLDSLVGPPPAQAPETDLAKNTSNLAGNVIKDVGSGAFSEAGHWAIGGPMKAMQSFMDIGKELAQQIGGPRLMDENGHFNPSWQSSDEIKKRIESGEIQPLQLPNVGGVMDTPQTYTASILQGLMQFGTGYGAAGKMTGIGNSVGGSLVKAFIADTTAFHGNEGNFANMLQVIEQASPGTMGPINEYVNAAASSEDDANLEGRLKNGLVNTVPNVLVPFAVAGAKYLRARRVAQELNPSVPALGQPPAPPAIGDFCRE